MRLPRAVKQQAAYPAQDALFVNSRRTGGNLITKWYVNDPFGANTRTAVDISVADYDLPPDISQPSGSTLDTGDCRLTNAVQSQDVTGGTGTFLYTNLHEANLWGGDTVDRAVCRLYQFNTSNNAVILDRIFGGPSLYYTFPTVAADFANNAYWVFSRGGPAEFLGVRAVETDAGIFVNSSTSIQPGSTNTTGTRWGSYFGASVDHNDGFTNARVWITGAYALAGSWDTTIASISNYTRGTLSVDPNTDFNVTGDLGGTFTPNTQNYFATNTGQTGLTYNVLETLPWLTTSRTSNNQLYSLIQTTTATVNTAQPVGFYSGTITFTDCALNGVTHVRNVSLTVRPLNNLCTRALPLNPGTITASNLHADGSDLTTCGGLDTKDIWYAFIAPCSGTLQVDTLDTPGDTDSTLAAFNACGSAQIACNDNFNSLRSRIRIPVTGGNTYYFRVAGANGVEGTWNLYVGYTSDLNRDGLTDFFDYLDFVADFSANDPRADFNADGVIDFFDYLDFVAEFSSAC
ncbi:MAG: hypothetical protein KGS45_00300 [Planctomycetes bacterium]|nr:hypothetical protein [Planctomycetota bacterium]